MNTITVLLFTVWLHVGGATLHTARAIVAPDDASCKADSPMILDSIKKAGITIGKKTYPIEKISGICLTFDEPRNV